MLFVGDDWAEAHHDIELQDGQGKLHALDGEERERGIPLRAVALVLPPPCDGAQRFQNHAVAQGGRNVGMVERRAHLDDVDAGNAQAFTR